MPFDKYSDSELRQLLRLKRDELRSILSAQDVLGNRFMANELPREDFMGRAKMLNEKMHEGLGEFERIHAEILRRKKSERSVDGI